MLKLRGCLHAVGSFCSAYGMHTASEYGDRWMLLYAGILFIANTHQLYAVLDKMDDIGRWP